MLKIRLQRAGKKNRPEFRVVLAESTAAAGKKFNEILGSYNPRTKALVIKDPERLQYWIKEHVILSESVHNLFVTQKLIEAPKVKAFSVPKKKVEEAPKSEPVNESKDSSTEAPAETPEEKTE